MFISTREALKRHPFGFKLIKVDGEHGAGKSVYVIKSMMQGYQIKYDVSQKISFKMAMAHTVYLLEDLIDLIEKYVNEDCPFIMKDYLESGEPALFLHWDDAGAHGSKYKFYVDKEEVMELNAISDTIRSAVTCFFTSQPSSQELLSFYRGYEGWVVQIYIMSGNDYRREARIYRSKNLPSGTRRMYPVGVDPYSCFLNNLYYAPYYERRKEYLRLAIQKYKERQTEKEKVKWKRSRYLDVLEKQYQAL